uniref:Uncharacterized protein n=1 Tax=Kalanchoe fedtschenkoi TaxID=63787 RepID=A0A7N0SY67_KALFE
MMRRLKVQPIETDVPEEFDRAEPLKPPTTRSRLVRLIPSVLLRTSSAEKVCANEELQLVRDGSGEFEPSSVCLAKMVQNFMEESGNNHGEKTQPIPVRCGRKHCNCFNNVDSSDDEPDCFGGCFGDSNPSSAVDACDILKSLVPCSSVAERNLLADTARLVEKNKVREQRAEGCRKFVTDGLVALGYNASICKSRWEKTPSYPAGEYDYIDVIHEGERLLIDVDFRSEFEIARPTKTYKNILQTLPLIFVGKPNRLQKIITTVTDAAKQSLKKKGLHFPPWRKAEYVKCKWLAPYTRIAPTPEPPASTTPDPNSDTLTADSKPCSPINATDSELPTAKEKQDEESLFPFPEDDQATPSTNPVQVMAKDWNPKPPQSSVKPKTGFKVVTGLASIMKD